MKKIKTLSLLVMSIFIFSTSIHAEDKYLVSYELIKSMSKDEVVAYWKQNGIPKFILPVEYGVDIYEIIYMAPWVDGTLIKASGIYYVPKVKKETVLPTTVYHHGTTLMRDRGDIFKNAQYGIALGLATDGYLSLVPDYYGLGKGEKTHLYQHVWSEAMSTIYMLYAVDELNKTLNVKSNSDLYLTGYSQGGHATLSAHKYIEELNDPRFKVVASAPMSGAYDMSGAQSKVMFEKYPQPFYLPYLLVSYQTAYNFWDGNIYEIFKTPYDSVTKIYLDGTHYYEDFNKAIPNIPADIIKPQYVEEFKANPNYPIKKRIEENNIYEWIPKSPTLFCYCSSDDQVSGKNSEVAYNYMKKQGAKNIKIKNLSNIFDHNECAMFAVIETKFFFDNIRKGKKKTDKGNRFKRFLIAKHKNKEEQKVIATRHEKQAPTEGLRTEAQK
ncbi:MAG: alpha/beta hydrolase [Chitinophagales bacterium]|nr:alpha/beta hydrolase [Chitinophagales bacterium]MCZ2393301.1 alpha/beta hydrolase [Chitinophagales bacterium]